MLNGDAFHANYIKSDLGFTYLGLMLFIAISGIGLSVAGISWQYQMRSEKERELLFVGAQYIDAIDSYYTKSPGAARVYPLTFEDLLLDKRIPKIQRLGLLLELLFSIKTPCC